MHDDLDDDNGTAANILEYIGKIEQRVYEKDFELVITERVLFKYGK